MRLGSTIPWLRRISSTDPKTVGTAAEQLAIMHPLLLRRSAGPWTRAQITDIVRRALESEIAMPIAQREMEMTFIQDLGMG